MDDKITKILEKDFRNDERYSSWIKESRGSLVTFDIFYQKLVSPGKDDVELFINLAFEYLSNFYFDVTFGTVGKVVVLSYTEYDYKDSDVEEVISKI